MFGCNKPASKVEDAKAKPAKVEKLAAETELATVTLSELSYQRLGVKTAVAEERSAKQTRTLGGDIMVPTGKTILVSSPVAGTIQLLANQTLPLPGNVIQRGQPIFNLIPILSPERDAFTPAEKVQVANAKATLLASHLAAQGDVQRSQAEVEAAQIALDRAEKLFRDKAGSRKAVDDARAQLNVSQSISQAATQRQTQLAKLIESLETKDGSTKIGQPLPIVSPEDGTVRNISIMEGQAVSANTPLFELIDTRKMWIRVPIYVDLIPTLDLEKGGQVVQLDGRPLPETRIAKPIVAPPTADSLASSADVYFEVDNLDRSLRPGQRVGLSLELVQESQTVTVVPHASIVIDVHGGTWVYLAKGERKFVRQRVAVKRIVGNDAFLSAGLHAGSEVVVDGAAEIFGTEFGAGK